MTYRTASILAAAGLCLVAAACAPQEERVQASLEDSVPPKRSDMVALAPGAEAPRQAASSPPIASLPPEAGAVVRVRTRGYADGLRQDITLQGSAVRRHDNGIVVLVRTDRRPTLDERVPLYKPSETGIRSEIGAQYPGIAMRVADRQSSNAYGPYGLALGRAAGGAHCLFMWQWIDANRLGGDAGIIGPVSIRVHLCQADTTFDAMAASLDHLTVGVDGSRIDVAMNESPAATDGKPTVRRSRHHVARHRPRRYTADATPREADIPDVSGPRYMAAPFAPAGATATAAAMASPASVPLSQDLPPQAYLGPKAVAAAKASAPSSAASSH